MALSLCVGVVCAENPKPGPSIDEIAGVWSVKICEKGFQLPTGAELLSLRIEGRSPHPAKFDLDSHVNPDMKVHIHIDGTWTITRLGADTVEIVQKDESNTVRYLAHYIGGFLTIGQADNPTLALKSLTVYVKVEYEGDAKKDHPVKMKMKGTGTGFDLGANAPT
jgi:hypothetical protein